MKIRNSKIVFGILIIVSLSGCFGFFEKEKPKPEPKPAAPEESVMPQKPVSKSNIQEPPSFDDGDIYLEALAKKDASRCAKIQNQKLRTRCEGQVKQ